MKREPGQLVNLLDAQEVAEWAKAIGATPHELRATAAIVGRSAGALGRYFQIAGPGSEAAQPGTRFFSRHPQAKALVDLFSRLSTGRPEDVVAQITPMLDRVIRTIQQGDIRLEYLPPEGDTVSIPPPSDDQYVQALLYWRIRFQHPIVDILEVIEGLGPDSPSEVVLSELNRNR